MEITWQYSFIHKYLLKPWYAQGLVPGSAGPTKMNYVYKQLPHKAESCKCPNGAEAGFTLGGLRGEGLSAAGFFCLFFVLFSSSPPTSHSSDFGDLIL